MDNSVSFCELCSEFTTRVCPFLSPRRSRLLFESRDFLVFPALGSFVEGYLLICPRVHVPSYASLEQGLLGKLQNMLDVTKHIVKTYYES
ncbi:MAG TPA: hypothetical protein VE713_00755, partial [Pyrinomonadaceae bacterium]|nr:hypothetical protein [Pyrinomonadaceae bacterium]